VFIVKYNLIGGLAQLSSLIFICMTTTKQTSFLQANNRLIIIYKYKIKNLLKTLISEGVYFKDKTLFSWLKNYEPINKIGLCMYDII